jgi:hypothetical protein
MNRNVFKLIVQYIAAIAPCSFVLFNQILQESTKRLLRAC